MRLHRALALSAVAASCLTVVSGAAAAPQQTLPIRVVTIKAKPAVKQKSMTATLIAEATVQTWNCQSRLILLGQRKARDEFPSPWSLPKSEKYRKWVLHQRINKQRKCLQRLQYVSSHTIPSTNDWLSAVAYVQRVYPGTSEWLKYISHREGGWGGFVMNHQGSGAGGWMQFMASTYYAYDDRAFADVARRGFIVNPAADAWTNPLGQAITAGYMRYVGLDGCHWCL